MFAAGHVPKNKNSADRRLQSGDRRMRSGPRFTALRFEQLENRWLLTAALQTLHSFSVADDEFPYANLTLVRSTLFGTTAGLGSPGNGTVFSINTDGTGYQVLHSFSPSAREFTQPSQLTLVDSTLFGTTRTSGSQSGGGTNYGTVFSINTDGSGFQLLHSFSGTNGGDPLPSGLTLVGSTLFGTTVGDGSAGFGTVFSINTDGTGYQVLHSFSGGTTDGKWPFRGGLTLVGSTLFGTTSEGGSAGFGTVFSINTDGSGFQIEHSFSGTDGETPAAGLTLVGSTLFGTTSLGGSAGDGTVFSITPSTVSTVIPTLQTANNKNLTMTSPSPTPLPRLSSPVSDSDSPVGPVSPVMVLPPSLGAGGDISLREATGPKAFEDPYSLRNRRGSSDSDLLVGPAPFLHAAGHLRGEIALLTYLADADQPHLLGIEPGDEVQATPPLAPTPPIRPPKPFAPERPPEDLRFDHWWILLAPPGLLGAKIAWSYVRKTRHVRHA